MTIEWEKEPRYCPRCRTPWVSGNDFCVGGCGWTREGERED